MSRVPRFFVACCILTALSVCAAAVAGRMRQRPVSAATVAARRRRQPDVMPGSTADYAGSVAALRAAFCALFAGSMSCVRIAMAT